MHTFNYILFCEGHPGAYSKAVAPSSLFSITNILPTDDEKFLALARLFAKYLKIHSSVTDRKVINTLRLITPRERNSLRSEDHGLQCLCLLLTTSP